MKRLAFIAVFAIISVYFVGCAIGGDSSNIDSSNTDSTPTLSSEDYSHLPECQSREDYIKGCLGIYNHETGKYRKEIPFKNAQKNGIQREYFVDKTICETKLVDSIQVGASVCFDKDGKLKNGVMKEYYDNGNLAFENTFKNGRREGVSKSYDKNGNLIIEIPYKDGKTNGMEKLYLGDGKLLLETPYKDGNIDGVQKWHRNDWNLEKEIRYKDGRRDGEEKWYRRDGSLYFSITFKNDKAISGKCGDGREIDANKLPKFDGFDTFNYGCD